MALLGVAPVAAFTTDGAFHAQLGVEHHGGGREGESDQGHVQSPAGAGGGAEVPEGGRGRGGRSGAEQVDGLGRVAVVGTQEQA